VQSDFTITQAMAWLVGSYSTAQSLARGLSEQCDEFLSVAMMQDNNYELDVAYCAWLSGYLLAQTKICGRCNSSVDRLDCARRSIDTIASITLRMNRITSRKGRI
jgi:hypothetical protein